MAYSRSNLDIKIRYESMCEKEILAKKQTRPFNPYENADGKVSFAVNFSSQFAEGGSNHLCM